MTSTRTWQRHGCYHLGSNSFYNMDLGKSVAGCQDDWNSLDHFDPTTDSRRIFAHMFYLRSVYPALQDGWNLVQWGNWTYEDQLPGSNGTLTEKGLWSTSRSALPLAKLQRHSRGQLWLLYSNVNETTNLDRGLWRKEVDFLSLPSWRRRQELVPPLRELHARSIPFSLLPRREGSVLWMYEQHHDGTDGFQSLGSS
jgi:hypothetical protein